jgi:ribosomal protein S18 acetylase RimI-like enzyme
MSGIIHIREANVDDAPGITHVHIDAWRTTYRGIVPDETLDNINVERREEMWQESISNPERDNFVYVAENVSGEVVGFASGGPESSGEGEYNGELYAIYILEDYQRQGIGRQLTETVIHRLVKDGFSSMLLWVLKDNESSREFYEKMDGEFAGQKQYEIGGKMLDAVGYGWKDIRGGGKK